jgi:uncharacterized protein YdeI (YjbR/CyaY-like superfamily)
VVIKTIDFDQVEVVSASQLRNWLEIHHEKYISTAEILDEILCFGWIDGVRRKLDENRTMQLLSRRRTQYWAKSYKVRTIRLMAQGRMCEAGIASIDESKRNGLWDFMDDVDALIIPNDLERQLKVFSPAAENFNAFSTSYRRNVLRWIKIARTPTTRAKRIYQASATAAWNEKIQQM